MPRIKPDVAFSAFIIILALLAPIGIAYVADYMRTATALVPKFSMADYVTDIRITYENSSGLEKYNIALNYVVDAENDIIIIPALPSDLQTINAIKIFMNYTEFPPASIWSENVVRIKVWGEASSTIEQLSIGFVVHTTEYVYLPPTLSLKPNSTSFETAYDFSTIALSRYGTVGDIDEWFIRLHGYDSQRITQTY